MQNQINVLRGDFSKHEENLRRNLNDHMRNILSRFFQNQPLTSGTLSSNTIPNPKGEMKAVTTRSGLAYEGPSVPTKSPLEKVDEQNTEEILDKEHSNSSGSTAQVQPPVVPILIPKPDVPRTQSKPLILYPSSLNDQKLREKATNQMEKFFQIFHDLHFDISFVDALLLTLKFALTIKSLLANKDKRFELPKVLLNENCSAMLLKKLPEKLRDPNFKAGPRVPLILGRSFLRIGRALIDVYGEEITLRVNDESITFNLSQTMRYSSTYDDTSVNRVDVIDVACEDFVHDVLDFQYNPKSSSPTLVSDDLIFERDSCKVLIVKSSSPTLTLFGESDFFLKQIKDFLNDDLILIGIKNSIYDPEGDILFLEKLLNEDPFSLPPMDLKVAEESKEKSSVEEPPELELKELPSHLEYAFLEDSNKLPVIIVKNPKVDEKEALINVLKSHKWAIAWKISDIKGIDPRFCTHKILMEDDYKPAVQSQRRVNPKIHDIIKKERCMMSIFHDMIKKTMEVFMDDFSVIGDSFSSCLTNLDKMLNRCEETNLVLNWEKCHFMCKEGIVLGHKISKSGIEVDRAKVDVIAKLPHPTTVKGVRSFLGHECIEAFNTLKKKLIEAPILVIPDWNLPFELMCNASDYAIGAVLGQRKLKHFQPIHYATKTMTEAQIHYTTIEKEMLTVVYASEKFRPYLVLSKIIVYTDHSALKYLLNKHDAKPRVMIKYGVTHRLDTAYHPRTRGKVEVSNRGLKQILERTVGENRTSWSDKLDDALWVFRTAYKILIGCTPYKLVYGKSCHLPIELEHRAYWALKHVIFDLKTAGDHRKLQLNELSELRDQAYENSVIYKERMKKLHDSKIKNRIFNVGDQVLLFNSCLKILFGKLKTHWSCPFTITRVFPYGIIELSQPNGLNFKVNGHRVKHYFGGDVPSNVAPDLHTFPMDN
uniref:DNA-directed DNA polymerase n=1 Tax=Tanacetum cinerariifolium TaxID=118510 RepID=A0A6L2LPT1_TANCI|nr:DNA-directed DNA polymerase [Tanacetum cinerariifolium]